VPIRARVASLKHLFDSLAATTYNKQQVDVWVYVDHDDEVTKKFIASNIHATYPYQIHWWLGERTQTQGEMTNILWQHSTTNASIYIPAPDDYVFNTPHWDETIRATFNRYPNRILLAYPDEPTASAEQVTFIILSAEWINSLGHFLTAYFPYWYDDTWLDQVAQMVQRKIKVEIQVNPQGNKGKTIRMRNLRFWSYFFHHTHDERVADAERLRQAIYGEGTPEYRRSAQIGAQLAAQFKTQTGQFDLASIAHTERHFAHEDIKSKPSERYLIVETDAARHLFDKASGYLKQDNPTEALYILNTISYALQHFTHVAYARALCLQALGRWDEAQQAARAELAFQSTHPPTHALLNQLFARAPYQAETLHTLRGSDLVPMGDNPNAVIKLSWRDELRVQLMPITLRLGLIWGIITMHSLAEWPAAFQDLWRRFWRRRAQ
jgi:hypothetical protein